jgi:predicted permease
MLAAMTPPTPLSVQLGNAPTTARIQSQLVSGDFFQTFGVGPALGRLLSREDTRTFDGHPVVVLEHGFWQRQFGKDLNVIGRSLLINGQPFVIVGVTEPGFRGVWADSSVQMWIPLVMQHALNYRQNAATVSTTSDTPWSPNPRVSWLNVVFRSPSDQRDIIETAFARLYYANVQELVDDGAETSRVLQRRLHAESFARGFSNLRGQYSAVLTFLMWMVTLLLLLACANVANLLLARWTARQREFAVRLSLGAKRGRLVRQLLTEGLMLSVVGGVAGALLADWISTTLAGTVLAREVLPTHLALDRRVLMFCAIVSITNGLMFSIVPSLRSTSGSLGSALRLSGTAGSRAALAMRPLIGAQVALSVVLVAGAGLVGRSLVNLWRLNPGYDHEHLVQIRIDPRAGGVRTEELPSLYQQITERAMQKPGVVAAEVSRLGLASGVRSVGSVTLEGYAPAPGESVRFLTNQVGPTYFSTVGMTLIQGRSFTERDVRGQPGVAIVNESAARRYFGGINEAIGKRVDAGVEFDFEIVGVVQDARVNSLREAPSPMAFYPLMQWAHFAQVLDLRVSGDAVLVGEQVRRMLNQEEPRLLANSRSLHIAERLDRGVLRDRMVASLAAAFGFTALLLTCVGLYGVLSYSVARRTSELGLRMAIGATAPHILRLVLGDGMRVTLVGLLVGTGSAVGLNRLIAPLLFSVQPIDITTLAVVPTTIALVASATCWLPARRAAKVDPIVALRCE